MTWGVPLSVSYHFAFSYCHGVLKARILKWLAIPFSSGPHSVRPLHHDPPILGCPRGMAWFHWVRQGCGSSVIRLTSFLWVWFQCVYPLMLSHNTYHLTWVSCTLGMGYLFRAAPAKHSLCSWPWMRGISLLPLFLTFSGMDWDAKEGSQETPGVTGKFGLGIQNEAGQRLIEFCQENALVIANTPFQ